MRIYFGLVAMLAVYLVHFVAAVFFNVYDFWPNFDIPSHFAGGLAVGLLGVGIHHSVTKPAHRRHAPWWHHMLFVLGFAALVAIGWEFYEFALDNFIGKNQGSRQISIADTMLDLFLGIVGAFIAFLLLRKRL